MSDFLPPVVAELLLNSSQFSEGLAKADVEMGGFSRSAAGAGKAAAAGLAVAGVAAVGIGVASIKMAADFQTSMTRIRTQAHDTTDNLTTMGNAVLALAPKVGFGPTALADALYHVTSVGYRGADAMGILKIGAEGARISGASLDDTIYGLTSTMKTFSDTGVAGATKDMALLNAIVGAGDMRMQDLNAAIQTGILSTGQTFGVSLQSMGAALTFLTDRGEKADVASTRLAMGITLMAAPTTKAAGILKDIGVSQSDIATGSAAMSQALKDSGVTQTQLAADLRKPDGIYVALQDLKTAMDKGGIAAADQGEIISKVFGGARTGKAIMALYENLDQIPGKFDAIGKGVSRFGQDWADTQKTFSQQMHQFTAGIDAAGIRIGLFLIPKVLDLGKKIGDTWHAFMNQPGGTPFANFAQGFQMPKMTNFNSGIDGAMEHAGISVHNFLDAAGKLADKLYQGLLPAFKNIYSFITQSLWPSLQNLWQVIKQPLADALTGAVGTFQILANLLNNVVGPALTAITGFMKDHKKIVDAVIISIGAMWLAWKGYTIVQAAITAIEGMTAAFAALDAAMAANPIGLIVVAIAGISAAIFELWTNWDQVWGWIEHHKAYSAIIAAITAIVAPFVLVTVGLVWLAKNWHDVWTGIETVFLRIADGILVGFKGVVDGVYTMVEGILDAASHLPFVGHHFAVMEAGVKKTQGQFDGDMQHMIDGIHGMIDAANAVPPLKRVTFTSTGVPNVVGDITRINTALEKIGSSYVVSVGGTGRKLIPGAAKGMLVPGSDGATADNHLIRVSSGEAVVPAHLVGPIAPFLGAHGVPGFASGGRIGPTNVSVDTMGIGNSLFSGYGGIFSGASGGGSVGGGASQWLSVVLTALALNGASAMWAPAVLKQIQFESGGNPNAHQQVVDINTFNGSGGAQGLMQVLLATFLSNHVPGTSMNIFDPLANVAAGVHHAIHEDPGGLSYLGQGHGYANGGDPKAGEVAWVGERGRELVRFGRDAHVFNAAQSRAMTGGGGNTYYVTINTLDPSSMKHALSQPGAATVVFDQLDRHVQRTPASGRPSWTN